MIRLESLFDQLSRMGETCSFCDGRLYDSTFFDAGNNAEVRVVVNCCEAHALEVDADGGAFQEKYSARIEELAAQAAPRAARRAS